jgi:hypothetical protein
MHKRLLSLLMALIALAANAAEITTEKLPVRRVVLYKNGVGYFEHTGRVRGSQELKIDFTSAQLNDVLKSLTVLDLNGGKISGVGYNSVAPIAEQLKALRLPLDESTTLEGFLNALRGTRIEVHNGPAVVAGRLLSVEEKTTHKGQEETGKTLEISLVGENGTVRTFPITSAVSVRVADHDLGEEIAKYLSLVSSARDQDLRQMNIAAGGVGDRNIFVSYISEVPVWKSTYRILLPAKADASPLLQGWAIVDNTVGEDWKDVELSLVAGAPQSFIQELSKPYYTRRPVIELPQTAMLTPQTHEGTMEENDRLESFSKLSAPGKVTNGTGIGGGIGSGSAGGVGFGRGAPGVGAGTFQLGSSTSFRGIYGVVRDPSGAAIPNAHITAAGESGEMRTAYSDSNGNFRLELQPGKYNVIAEMTGFRSAVQHVQFSGGSQYLAYTLTVGSAAETIEVTSVSESLEPAAYGQELGDLFQYNLKERVTILKNQSALVPIINAHIKAEKVTLWSGGSERPLRALWITNSSGLTLDGGAFNVLEDNAFAGEGIIDPLKPEERRLLSYAVDQGVRIEHKDDLEARPITHIKIAKGVMVQTSEQRDHQRYTIRNTDAQAREVVIEHPVRAGWKLADGLKPEETSASFYRFRVKVEPRKTAELKVDEIEPLQKRVALSNVTDDQIRIWFNDQTIKPELEQALQKVVAKKNEIAGLERELQERQSQVGAINQDQERLRENMKALKGSAEEKALLQRYTRELNDQEDKLQAVRGEMSKLEQQRNQGRQQLDKILQDLTLDEAI